MFLIPLLSAGNLLAARASSAAASVASQASLDWRDLNVIVVTDVHSWVNGHHQKDYQTPRDADYGDLWSFHHFLSEEANRRQKDLFFVNNGDIVDGTGISDGTTTKGEKLMPILKRIPFDLVNTGNHELYHDSGIGNINKPGGFADHFRGKYITSNVVNSTNGETLGLNYTHLYGSATGRKYAAFGFLYNMMDHCDAVLVRRVQDTIALPWFSEALIGTNGSIIIAHMGYSDPLVSVILSKMRELRGIDYPVVFFTGHTHIRAYTPLDANSVSFEAGHYFDTVGFLSLSFPDQESNISVEVRQIDANRETLAGLVGKNVQNFKTSEGEQIKQQIKAVRKELDLDRIVGCNPSYLDCQADTTWDLYINRVIPHMLNVTREKYFAILSKGGLRYNLWSGKVTWDDIIIFSPFMNKFVEIKGLNGSAIRLLKALPIFSTYAVSNTSLINDVYYDFITQDFDLRTIQNVLTQHGYNFTVIGHFSGFDTTTVWRNYSELYWRCGGGDGGHGGSSGPDSISMTIIVAMIIFAALTIPFAFYIHKCVTRREKNRNNFRELLEEPEEEREISANSVL